jgi:hypothetical protein
VPFGNYTTAQTEYLQNNPLKIDARFALHGFKKIGWVNFMRLSLSFTGEVIGARKQIIPDPRVVGTNYWELISVNDSFKFKSGGNFAPLPKDQWFYLLRPGKSGEYYKYIFDF